jgi:hypothetical protein
MLLNVDSGSSATSGQPFRAPGYLFVTGLPGSPNPYGAFPSHLAQEAVSIAGIADDSGAGKERAKWLCQSMAASLPDRGGSLLPFPEEITPGSLAAAGCGK